MRPARDRGNVPCGLSTEKFAHPLLRVCYFLTAMSNDSYDCDKKHFKVSMQANAAAKFF